MAAAVELSSGVGGVGTAALPPCTYCLKKMGRVGVKCAVCEDFYICLHCFSVGAEIATHRKEHDYCVLDAGQVRLFDKPLTWTASETFALLDGVEHHGFGNWANVGKSVPTRTPEECARFFVDIFVNGNLGRVFNANRLDIAIQDHSTQAPPISLLPPVEMTLEEKRELGYYPMRDDYELEYDHNAEQLVADLVFRADDDQDEVAYKMWLMDRYRLRLRNRIKHKSIAREYGLVVPAESLSASNSAPPAKTIRGANNNTTPATTAQQPRNDDMFSNFEFLRPLSRYKSAEDMKILIENLNKEKSLRNRIKQLTNLKRLGHTKLKSIDEAPVSKRNGIKHRSNGKAELDGKDGKMGSSNGKSSPPDSPSNNQRRSYPTRSHSTSPTLDEYSNDLADMMTDREKKMCHSMKMSYKTYFSAKTAILKDYLARRRGCPVKLRYPPGLDPAHRRKIISLMTDNGWLTG